MSIKFSTLSFIVSVSEIPSISYSTGKGERILNRAKCFGSVPFCV